MAITPLPTPPSRNDPTNFSARGDAFLGALPAFATEANALAVEVNADAAASAVSASTASAAAISATAAANAIAWVSGTTYTAGTVVYSPVTYLAYRRKTNGAGTTDPSLDTTNWALSGGTGNVFVENPGSIGQVLQSFGPGNAPAFQTIKTGTFGTDLSFEDYSLSLPTAIGISAVRMQAVSLDGISELMILFGTGGAYAVVFNTSTNSFGIPVLVRSLGLTQMQNVAVARVSATSVLVCSLANGTTALQTVVLSVSGSTITVNTAVSTTLAASCSLIPANTRLVNVGSSYVLNYFTTADSLPKFRAITVSGGTPSIGSELAYAGGNTGGQHHSYAYNSSTLLHFSVTDAAFVYAFPIVVSGTTLTAGTQATAAVTSSAAVICTGALSTGRFALLYRAGAGGIGALVSVTGSTASIASSATALTISSGTWNPTMQIFSNQAFIASNADQVNILTDTGGVVSVGTAIATPYTGNFAGFLSGGKIIFADPAAGSSGYSVFGIVSNSPVIEKTFNGVTSVSVATNSSFSLVYGRPLSGPPQTGGGMTAVLRTSGGKIALASSNNLPFSITWDGNSSAKVQQSANPFTSYNDSISESVAWGLPTPVSSSTTAIQIRKVTLV